MENSKTFKNRTQSRDAISEMQIEIVIHKGNAKYQEERANQLEQDYYNRACGCSVKAQEDNLFDYKTLIKEVEIFD